MKKLLTVILILAMLLPAMALADDPDPVIGAWYYFMDFSMFPELSSALPGYDYLFTAYKFNADNTITGIAAADGSNGPESEITATGKWEKSGDIYKVSIVGLGNVDAIIEDGYLFLKSSATSPAVYLKLIRIKEFDPYQDYTYR